MDDKLLFENKTTLNKSIFLDGVKLWIKSTKAIKILLYFMALICTCLTLFYISIHSYFWAFMQLVIVAFVLFYPKIIAFTIIKKQKYTFGSERTYSIYSDRLEIKVAQNRTVIPFYMVKIAGENKNNFYMIYENQIICISKKGFTIGDLDTFSKFIKSKIKFK